MEEKKKWETSKRKAHACIFAMNLVKGTESCVGTQQVHADD